MKWMTIIFAISCLIAFFCCAKGLSIEKSVDKKEMTEEQAKKETGFFVITFAVFLSIGVITFLIETIVWLYYLFSGEGLGANLWWYLGIIPAFFVSLFIGSCWEVGGSKCFFIILFGAWVLSLCLVNRI